MAINERATVEVQVNGEQAKQELKNIESYANSLKGRLAEAYKAGDTKQIKVLEKELKATNSELKTMRTNAKNIEVAMNNIGLATPKELRVLLKDINAKLNSGNIRRGSAEWDDYQSKLKLVNTELRKLKQENLESESFLSRLGDKFNRYSALAVTTIASLSGLTFTIRKAVESYAEMEEAKSQVVKYTGLEKQEVDDLNETLKKMDTRTARTKLNALAGDAGKLGITGKKNILEFVDAADKINVALGEDLGEDAVKNIGKLAQMFGEDKKKGLRGAMLATGSAVNAVGQSSSAAESYLVGFTARIAGTAQQAKIAQGNIIGYASVLDQNMQQQEMAATAFQTLMMKMFQNPAKFAKMAGQDVKEFTSLIKTDANEAILQFLETLNKKGGLDKLAPLFKDMGLDGVRASGVISTMAGKIDDIRAAQKLANDAYREGTSLTTEFNVQNNTVQAGIDKAKNKFNDLAVTLGKDLLPVARYAISTGSLSIKLLQSLISLFREHGGAIVYVTAVLATYVIAQKLQWFWLNKVKTETGQYIVIQKLKEFWDKAVAASTWLYIAATSALTGKTGQAKLAMQAFWLILKANPFASVLTIITAVAGALYLLSRRASEARRTQILFNDIQNEATSNISAEKAEVESLYRIAKDETKTKDDRLKAIKKLNDISPNYLKGLTLETIGTNKAKDAVDDYVNSLLIMAEVESAKSRLTDVDKELSKLKKDQKEYLNERETFLGALKALPRNMGSMLTFGIVENTAEKKNKDVQEMETERVQLLQFINKKVHEEIGAQPKEIDKTSISSSGGSNNTGNKKMLVEEKRYQEELRQLKQQYLDSNEMTQDEYARFAEDLELKHLNNQLKIAGVEPEERQKIQQKILDTQIQFKQKCLDEEKKQVEEQKKNQDKANGEALAKRKKQYELELSESMMFHFQNKTSEQDYIDETQHITDKYYADLLDNYQLTEEEKTTIQTEQNNLRTEKEKKNYEKAKARAEGYKNITEDIAKEFGENLGEMIASGELNMKNFLRDTLLMALDALERVLMISALEIQAKNMAATAPLSFLGVMKATAEVALLKIAFETAKAAIGNFYTGGFTGSGEWDEPKGVVHSNEFVANRHALANPEVLPVLKLLNAAQQSNTIGTLTSRDISNVLRGPSSSVNSSSGTVQVIQTSDPEMKKLLADCTTMLQTVKKRFDHKIVAETYVAGRGGINKAMTEYDKLMKNVQR